MTDLPIDQPLTGHRIMVVEDEVILALDLALTLQEAGAEVAGPFYRIQTASALADLASIDCAVLDVDIAGSKVFPLAERLRDAGVPILFHSANARLDPLEFGRAALCRKPSSGSRLIQTIERLVAGASADAQAGSRQAAAR
jgi:DNA-binding response OmpR family regulator